MKIIKNFKSDYMKSLLTTSIVASLIGAILKDLTDLNNLSFVLMFLGGAGCVCSIVRSIYNELEK